MLYINVNQVDRTIQPVDVEGDEAFGLLPGTNGTAATQRRDSIAGVRGYVWLTSDGQPARGLWYQPSVSAPIYRSPWSGR